MPALDTNPTKRLYRSRAGAVAIVGFVAALSTSMVVAESDERGLADRLTDNAAVQTVNDVFGFVKKKTAKVLGVNKDVPQRIAVLPATGVGEQQEQADISNAIHNNLGISQFDLLKPHEIERKLSVLEHKQGKAWTELSPRSVAEGLGIDGVLYVHVDEIDKVYAAAYAHYSLTVSASLYAVNKTEPVWVHTDSIVEREGGVSLNPLGIIATAVTSATVLGDATRIQLVDQLARKFAEQIPEPAGSKRILSPRIALAMSNAAEGPFRAGDELKVFMEGDPQLSVEFFINDRLVGDLEEQSEGNYVGRYIVGQNEQLVDAVLAVKAMRPRDKAVADWRLPGRVSFDTEAPAAISSLDAAIVDQGVRLVWPELQDRGSELTYEVERTDRDSGAYAELNQTVVGEFLDTGVSPGRTYFYRITPVDKAGNKGGSATARVSVVAPGPTNLDEDILADRLLPAIGSPYRINQILTIGRGSSLVLEPGTIVEMSQGSGLQVLGRLEAIGTESAPVTFKGMGARLLFDNTGTAENRLSAVQLRLADSEVVLENSVLTLENALISGVDLIAGPHSHLHLLTATVTGASAAVSSQGGSLSLRDSTLSNNRIGIELRRNAEAVNVSIDNIAFNRNDIHLRSDRELVVNAPRFTDESYEAVLERTDGPITINWDGLPPAQNLQLRWLQERWKVLLGMLKRQQWSAAREQLLEIMDVDTGEAARILHDALASLLEQPPRFGDLTADVYQQLEQSRRAGKSPFLWVQRVQIPSSQKLLSTEAMVLPKARQRFGKDYLRDNYGKRRRDEAYLRGSGMPLHESILADKLLYRQDRGLVSDFWILYAVDSEVLDHYLSIAGLIHRERSDLVVSVAAEGDEMLSLKRELFRLLTSQNIPFVDLSGVPHADRFAHARKNKSDLLLTARSLGRVSESSLNANLNVVEVDVSLQVEAVSDGTLVANLHNESKSTTFRKRSGFERAIAECLDEVEGDLVRELAGYRKPTAGAVLARPATHAATLPTTIAD